MFCISGETDAFAAWFREQVAEQEKPVSKCVSELAEEAFENFDPEEQEEWKDLKVATPDRSKIGRLRQSFVLCPSIPTGLLFSLSRPLAPHQG